MSQMLENLRAQWGECKAQIEGITERAAIENRGMNAAEQANFDALRGQIEDLTPRIEQMVEVERSFDTTSDLLSSVSTEGRTSLARSQGPAIASQYETPGDYLYDVFRGFGPAADAQVREKLRSVSLINRDATTQINGATVQNETLAEIASVVPHQYVGDIWSNVDARRPIAMSYVQRGITGPLMFRPKITQHTKVGPQGTGTPAGAAGKGKLGMDNTGAVANNDEKAAFVSRKMTLGRLNIEPIAVGGVVDISLWAEMFSPSLLNTIISDLAEQYAIETESLAAAELVRAGATSTHTTVDLTAATAAVDFQKAVFEQAAAVYGATGRLPTHVAMGVGAWAALGGLGDTTNRPSFPTMGVQNSMASIGANTLDAGPFAGLQMLVSPALSANQAIVYASGGMELFERRLGVLQAIEPERAGRVVSYSGLCQAVAIDDGAASMIPVTV